MAQAESRIRIVYFGTPGYAVPALRALAGMAEIDIALVVTQPDRPAGRGRKLLAPAVKVAAEQIGLPVYQPERLKSAEARQPLLDIKADLFIVAAYGLIFGSKTLAIPGLGCLNLHASLLPNYRGASPVTVAILAGDRQTGVTLMQMDAGMDTGGVIAQSIVAIEADDTSGTLTERLAEVGANLIVSSIGPWVAGELNAVPQNSAQASLVRPLVKADGWIDWGTDAAAIERKVRAMQPWPRAFTTLPDGSTLQVLSTKLISDSRLAAGEVAIRGREVLVGAGDGVIQLVTVQLPGGNEIPAESLVQSRRLKAVDRLGDTPAPQVRGPLVRAVGQP